MIDELDDLPAERPDPTGVESVDAVLDAVATVGERPLGSSWATRIGTKSVTVRQELVQDGEVAIRADVVLVMFDFATDTSRPLTDVEREHWAGYLEA